MGVRHVRDAQYWGLPVGTPIVPGMKSAALAKMASSRDNSKTGGKPGRNTRAKSPKGAAAKRFAASNPRGAMAAMTGATTPTPKPRPANTANRDTARDASDEQLADMFAQLSQADSLDEEALARVLAEMDRREQGEQRVEVAPGQAEADAQIDQLLARGWEFRDAYAEVHGVSDDELRRQELNAALDINRRSGETREQAVRRLYAEWVHLQYLAAERATSGHVLTSEAEARGIDPISLFSGPAARARKWASEDLKRWWADNGRVTYTEWRADMLGRPSDRAKAEQIRKQGQDRDFGL
jgi:hypothetical protein